MHVVQMPSLLERLGSLTAIRDTELLEQSLLKTLLTTLNIENCSLYRTNDKQDFLRVIHFHLSPGSVERVEVEYSNFELSNEVHELIETVRRTLDHASRRVGQDTLNVYPLFGRAGVNGYLVLVAKHALSMSHNAILRGVLQLYRNYYTLLDESQRDKLTGLLNRQALDQNLDRILATLTSELSVGHLPALHETSHSPEQRRYANKRLWLAIIDIDHFKRINDVYGHVMGDEILLMVTQTMHRCLREGDLLYRYGGEEFIVITTTDASCTTVPQLERLRLSVADRSYPQVGRVTVSAGYTGFDGHVSATQVIAHADQALYEAKRAGRNQIACYADLVAAGVIPEETYGSVELF